MRYIDIQGERVPALGLGTWTLSGESGRRAIAAALDIGYRHIDTAQTYENEQEVGRVVKESGIDRSGLFVTTKIAETSLEPNDVNRSFEESLRKLQMDYVDLLLIHWPNPDVSLGQTLDTMLEQKEAGKARHIGVSNFTPELFREAADHTQIFCNQVEYHPFLGQKDVLDAARAHDAMVTAYSPIARGRVNRSGPIQAIARMHGKSPTQVALRWLIQQESVAAIPRSSKPDHLRANFEVFDFELSDDEMEQITSLAYGERIVDPGTAPWNA